MVMEVTLRVGGADAPSWHRGGPDDEGQALCPPGSLLFLVLFPPPHLQRLTTAPHGPSPSFPGLACVLCVGHTVSAASSFHVWPQPAI